MAVKYFIMHIDYKKHIDLLSDSQAGMLFKAIYAYVNDETISKLDPMTEMAFSFIKAQIDRDLMKYKETCEKRKKAIEARWGEKNTSEYKCIQMDTNNNNNSNNSSNSNSNSNSNNNSNDNNTLSKANVLYINNNNKEKKELLNDEIWLESIMMKHHLSKADIELKLDEFLIHLTSIGQTHSNNRELKKHFNNWINTCKIYERKNNETVSANGQLNDKQRRAADFADYIATKLSGTQAHNNNNIDEAL